MSQPPQGASPTHDRARTRSRTTAIAFIADLVLVVAFTAAGRESHSEALALPGLASTAWPFVAALVLAWAIMQAWRRPTQWWPTGIGIWAFTVALGLLLRILAGQDAAGAFPLVATAFIAVFLLGWRVIFTLARLRRQRQNTRR